MKRLYIAYLLIACIGTRTAQAVILANFTPQNFVIKVTATDGTDVQTQMSLDNQEYVQLGAVEGNILPLTVFVWSKDIPTFDDKTVMGKFAIKSMPSADIVYRESDVWLIYLDQNSQLAITNVSNSAAAKEPTKLADQQIKLPTEEKADAAAMEKLIPAPTVATEPKGPELTEPSTTTTEKKVVPPVEATLAPSADAVEVPPAESAPEVVASPETQPAPAIDEQKATETEESATKPAEQITTPTDTQKEEAAMPSAPEPKSAVVPETKTQEPKELAAMGE